MNTKHKTVKADCGIANDVAFNHDCSYFCVPQPCGFSIYASATCELYSNEDLEQNFNSAAMLGSSQIIGLIGADGPSARKLSLYDFIRKKEMASIMQSTPITRTCLSKTHIAIVCERILHLYKHSKRIEKIAEYETSPNQLGLCSISSSVLVFPGRNAGHVQVVNLESLEMSIIPAHTSALRALEVSLSGTTVVTGSRNGTLLRVFSAKTGTLFAEFRRGVVSAGIYSLAISPSEKRLAVTSDTSTLHIFDMPRTTSSSSSSTPRPSSDELSNDNRLNAQKWGIFARLPFAPRVLTDNYSIASTQFDAGSDAKSLREGIDRGDTSSDRTNRKGVVGWLDDSTIAIISAGADARYERYALHDSGQGRASCVREGWSKFLKPN